MFTYFLIENGGVSSSDIRAVRESEEQYTSYNTKEASLLNGKAFIVPVAVTDPAFDPETQIQEGPVDLWDGITAERIYTVRDKNQADYDAEQLEDDLFVLRGAGKDIALVLTELVQWNLDNTAMAADDFTASVKQAYLDLKAIADRVK